MLTPIAKNRVRPKEPKYAMENGRRSGEKTCLTSDQFLRQLDDSLRAPQELSDEDKPT